MILSLSSQGVPVTGWTGTSVEALKGECMNNFGVQPDDYIDEALALLLVWAWERIPLLTPVLTSLSFPLARRCVNWIVRDKEQRRWRPHHYRQMLDNISNDSFLWTPYDEHQLVPNVVPNDIFTRVGLWNAPSPVISFECIEWCPTNRVLRQFGLAQGILEEPRDLGKNHNECLTGPKNKNWHNEYRD
ncbi:hypothetical protein PIB30_094861 [Stylosanthes scabra]|uniref:Aminotransferase-like plant mobile domain-containing protein n=1 Tax=Stylosanthes scabra TaxID=79078 RepID=A0ABU6ZUE5_9FABA|nr:hypothetical protein [Stylosanthes scabra]